MELLTQYPIFCNKSDLKYIPANTSKQQGKSTRCKITTFRLVLMPNTSNRPKKRGKECR